MFIQADISAAMIIKIAGFPSPLFNCIREMKGAAILINASIKLLRAKMDNSGNNDDEDGTHSLLGSLQKPLAPCQEIRLLSVQRVFPVSTRK